MELNFSTDYNSIIQSIGAIDPVQYGKNRNYIDGNVTYLSPYISRGMISTKTVLANVLNKGFKPKQIAQFIKELCWRDYFQRVAQHKNVNQEIKHPQAPLLNYEIPLAILEANTEIEGIDIAIKNLYQTGYMHNHCRMYTAALVCNIAKSHWHNPAQWMYFHLLDGDWASNACSWQWVCGANSPKKYYANQENINTYTHTKQKNSYLDTSYDAMELLDTPAHLLGTQRYLPETALPVSATLNMDRSLPTFVYNYYNLDPLWHNAEHGNRVLLLEPDVFSQYPVSKKCIAFMLDLSKNIPDIQVHVGSFNSLTDNYALENIHYKEHPLNAGYCGIEESRDWICEEVTGYYPSFFSYWKKVERELNTFL